MELRSYWKIIWRRGWIIILVVGIIAIYTGYQYYHLAKTPGALKAYQSNVSVRIGLQATQNSTDQSYADYISASETLADELATGPLITSNEFDTEVSQQIQKDMSQITQRFGPQADLGDWQNPGAIGSSLTATRAHSLVTISVTWSTPAGAWAIANAVGEVSVAHISSYLDYEIRNTTPSLKQRNEIHPLVSAEVISSATAPALVPGPLASKPTLLLVLVVVALIIGIALAFLIDYLDDRIRNKDEAVQLLQLPIYGEVPPAPTPGRNRSQHSPAA
ncbi:hypothetical protein EPA93_21605 [Ktedonosporobacter rubrisoli]|uniref:Polysaccharide chain length determinant N-terminal domain-containing protein n=1 Tax=Ktedonosporobacter rubrisoli TaxID=2509675 RepID=A0A4P6JSE8_KTERU|nr:hypothetical protein [Ktedonosporobacter rubrisoli]QBD78449.1 hypothetical protein EPA93_21605 [Ktedonosporobacter rubrisoli]